MSLYFKVEPSPTAEILGKRTFWLGIALLIVGTLGIVLPELLALTINYLIAWLLILGAALLGYITWITPSHEISNWLKPAILLVLGVLLVIFPEVGIATLTLLLAFYFMLDAVMNFALAKQIYPFDGWGWMVFNGFLTFILAVLALWDFPQNSAIFLGVIVGVSLILDGIVFARIGWALKKQHQVVIDE